MRLYLLSLNKYLADNRRSLILSVAGLMALMIFVGFINAYTSSDIHATHLLSISFYLGIFACVRTSLMFSSMKSPRGRISTLMSPASIWQKFAARWTVNVPVQLLVLFAAFWVAEITRVSLWPLFNDGATADWFAFTYSEEDHGQYLIGLIFSSILAAQAFFGFGAIAWPRMSALRSIIALWLIGIVFGITSGYVLMHYHFNWPLFSAERLLMTTIICNIVFTIILWGLAYIRFKESDVIDRLF